MRIRSFRRLVTIIAALRCVEVHSNFVWAESDARKPAAIETQEVPPVPGELFARLGQYQSVRGAAFRGWAPDGKGILITTRFGNAAQLHRVNAPAAYREQITFLDEPVTGKFIPRATDGSILLLVDSGGNENEQVYLIDRQKFQTTLLTDGKSRNKLGAIRHDGSRAIVASNQRNGRDSDLYTMDPHRPGSMKLVMQVDKQTWNAHDYSQDGKTVLISRYVSANESYPALLDVETGQRTDLPMPADQKCSVGTMAFSADGKSILLTSDADSEFNRLARFDRATQKYEWLTDDIKWDVTEVAVDLASGQIAFIVNADGASRLYLLDKAGASRHEFKLPMAVATGLEFDSAGKRLGFSLAKPNAPSEAFSVSLETGELTRWTFSEVGGLDPDSFVAPTRIQFASFDGRMIPAYYFQPRSRSTEHASSASNGNGDATKSKSPVYISIHGGPEMQYLPIFSPMIQFYLNELGVAVICPNVRGSNGYGKTYLKLDNAEKREDSVKDIGALLDWIDRQPELDATRVAVAGGSYGGYMTLATLTHFGNRIKAGVDIVGIANFITFLEKTAPYRADLRRAEYGDERDPKMRAVFETISPLNHADKIRAALMVVHGRNDPRVPFYEAEQIAAKVRSSGRPVWTVFADNEGHGFNKKDNSDYQRAVEACF